MRPAAPPAMPPRLVAAAASAAMLASMLLGAACAQTPAAAQLAADIALLMGSAPVGTAIGPNGIVVRHRPDTPAQGITIPVDVPPPDTYVWSGPLTATRGAASAWADKHPGLKVAMRTAVFFELLDRLKATPRQGPEFFVQVANGQFVTGTARGACRTVLAAGFNKFEFVEAGAGAPRLFDAQLTDPSLTGPTVVRRMLDQARSAGLNLLRMNAFAVDSQYSVASQPGGAGTAVVYNEGVLRGLDYVLDQAQLRRIRVLLVLTDYFADGAGGPKQYLEFAGVNPACNSLQQPTCDDLKAQFFVNPTAAALYRQYVAVLASRVNTVNGRTYKDDPTIWGWDLMNEPRCFDSSICTSAIHGWVVSQSAFIKSLDSNHLVTVGLDGLYLNSPGVSTNPFSNTYNTDWVADTGVANIDFGSFNVYPDLWLAPGENSVRFVAAWIAQHSADAKLLGKPAIIKEAGAQPTTQRVPLYTSILSNALSTMTVDADAAGGLKGALYFQGWTRGTSSVWWTLAQAGRFGVLPSERAFDHVTRFADGAARLDGAVTCTEGLRLEPVTLPRPSCPAGYEGPGCVDIDECVRGTDRCSANAACINTAGGYECQCHLTWQGNGRLCAANTGAQEALRAKFFTNGRVNGFPGSTNVAWPTTAPGWVADPTGYYSQFGSRTNVTLFECMVACDTAGVTECTSFFYNFVAANCFLKANECPLQQEQSPSQSICSYPLYEPNVANAVGTGSFVCGEGYTYYRVGAALPSGCVQST